jgi:hypothetical protein
MYRDYNDPQYKKFRNEVKNRDNRTCKWPSCRCKKKLNIHHILPWAKFPLLRFIVSNGITLCKKHHKVVTGKELQFAPMLAGLIR